MLMGHQTLTDLESFLLRRGRKICDTTFYLLLGGLAFEEFRDVLHSLSKRLYRAKALAPEFLPCHLIAVDNKSLYYGQEKLNEFCQETHDATTGELRYHLRTVGCTLVSSPLNQVLDRMPTPAKTNDMGFFPDVYQELRSHYRGLMDNTILSLDAGFCSKENADLIDNGGQFYVFSLKGNQSGLLEEAMRTFSGWREARPDAIGGWESYRGSQIRRRLYRTDQLEGWQTDGGCWSHLHQVWLVVQEERHPLGPIRKGRRKKREKVEWSEPEVTMERYFLSSVSRDYLSGEQILYSVRKHWAIENGTHWTLDTQFNEDAAPFCRKNEALLVLCLLRAMAMNMLNWLRFRHLKNETVQSFTWRALFDWMKEIMAGITAVGLSPGGVLKEI